MKNSEKMKRLSKTPEDIAFLKDLLKKEEKIKAIWHYFYFDSEIANSLRSDEYQGEIIGFDDEYEMAVFKSDEGWSMKCININMITII